MDLGSKLIEWACEKRLTAIRYGLKQFGRAKLYSVLCLVRYPPASPSGVEFIYEFLSLSLALCLCQNFSNPLFRRQQGPVAFFRRYKQIHFLLTKTKEHICLALNHERDRMYGCFLKAREKVICTQSLPVVKIYAVTFTGGQVWTKLGTKCFWQDGLVAVLVVCLARENADWNCSQARGLGEAKRTLCDHWKLLCE